MNQDVRYHLQISPQVYRHFADVGGKLTPGTAWEGFAAQFNHLMRMTGINTEVRNEIQSIPNKDQSAFVVHIITSAENNEKIRTHAQKIGYRPHCYIKDVDATALKSMGLRMKGPITDVSFKKSGPVAPKINTVPSPL